MFVDVHSENSAATAIVLSFHMRASYAQCSRVAVGGLRLELGAVPMGGSQGGATAPPQALQCPIAHCRRRIMRIRDFVAGDEKHLYAVFYSAVHQLAKEHYTAQQLGAWAPLAMDPDLWAQRMQGIRPFVVEDAGEILAYADVQPSGYIDHFFVSGRYARQGIGSMLMLHIHELATQRRIKVLTSDVSRTAQPFFRKFGFVVVAQRKPFVRGVVVLNAFMRKALITAPNQKPF